MNPIEDNLVPNMPKYDSQRDEDEEEEKAELETKTSLEADYTVDNLGSTLDSQDVTNLQTKDRQALISMTAASLAESGFMRPVKQKIQFNGTETVTSIGIYGNDVTVLPNSGLSSNLDTGSNKVRVSQVCKFDWGQTYYYGNLVACNQRYLAYVVRVKGNKDERVRVLNHHTSAKVLLKDLHGKVMDLAFASLDKDFLACMDSFGNLLIFLIEEGDGDLKYSLLLSIGHDESNTSVDNCCIAWIPYFHDNNDTELLIASSYDSSCFVLCLSKVFKQYGSNPTNISQITDGVLTINEGHCEPITKLVMSPDGAVLATSSLDGFVKFWGLNFEDSESPRCLHDWQPHDGEPVTSLFFCDDYTSGALPDSPSWRFVITGTKFNTELKVWCAVRWTCLQTVTFDRNVHSLKSDNENPVPCIKPMLDQSASYLIATDIKRQVLYVLQLYQSMKEEKAHFSSISEFLLAQPMISFAINEAKLGRDKDQTEVGDHGVNGLEDDTDEIEDEDTCLRANDETGILVSLKLFSVHTRALQKLSIKFNPKCSIYPPMPSYSIATSADDRLSVRDRMSDVSGVDVRGSTVSDPNDSEGGSDVNVADESFSRSFQSSSKYERHGSPSNTLTMVTPAGSTTLPDGSGIDSNVGEIAQLRTTVSHESSGDEKGEEEKPIENVELSGPQQLTILKRGDPLPLDTKESVSPNVAQLFQKVRRSSSKSGAHSEDLGKSKEDFEEGPAFVKEKEEELINFNDKSWNSARSREESGRVSLPSLKDIQIPSVDMPLKSSIPNEILEARDRDLQLSSISTTGGRDSHASVIHTPTRMSTGSGQTEHNSQAEEFRQILKLLHQQQADIQGLTKLCGDMSSKIQCLEIASSESNRLGEKEQLKQGLQALQKNVNSQLNKSMREFSKSSHQLVDHFINQVQASSQAREDKQYQDMTQVMSNAISGKLEKIVKSELKGILLPSLQETVGTSLDRINAQVAQKLSVIERSLKEEVTDMFRSAPVIDAVSSSVLKILEEVMPTAYRDAFKRLLLPAYENACKAMFDQINDAFQQGTGQYIQKLEAHLENRRQRQADTQSPLVRQLQGLVESFQATADRLTGSLESNLEALMQKQLSDSLEGFRRNFTQSVDENIRNLVTKTLQSHLETLLESHREELFKSLSTLSSSFSGTSNDGHLSQIKRKVESAIEARDFGLAFEEALTAADLNLVNLVCQHVQPEDVFTENPILSQPIILSLIQQLSVDLLSDTDLKVRYLQEALISLDEEDDLTAQHIPTVIGGLVDNLNSALTSLKGTEKSSTHTKSLKFLLMSASSLMSTHARNG